MASRGVNKVILIGNAGKDPEIRYTSGGDAVANLTIATSETWKDKTSGEPRENTEWHRLVFWRRLAEIVGEYVTKGSKIYIEGQLQTRKWQDQQGQDRYMTEVVVNEMQMLDGKPSGSSGTARPAGTAQAADHFQRPAAAAAAAGGDNEFEDDIPFAPCMQRAEYLV